MQLSHFHPAWLPAEIRFHQYPATGFVHAEVDRAIPKINVGIAHAGVFPIQQVEPVSALQKIRRNQVVVTRSRPACATANRIDNFVRIFQRLVQSAGHIHIVSLGGRNVIVDDQRKIKRARNLRGRVQPVKQPGHASDRCGVGRLNRDSLHETGDEYFVRGDEGHRLRGDANLPGHTRDRVFGLPVDTEHLGVFPRQTGDESFAAGGLDKEVLIREAARNRTECKRAPTRKFCAQQFPGQLC